jgi:uncharacterized protein (TIGR00369 family)
VSERTRTYSWHDPRPALEAARTLSGIDLLRGMMSGELPHPPIADVLGFRLVEVERGRAVFEGDPGEQHYNILGTVHAGYTTTLLDSAMGCALTTTLEAAVPWTTLELKANFTRAITLDTGAVRCIGTIVHPGRRVATTEARLEDPQGRLCAHAVSTILVLGGASR